MKILQIVHYYPPLASGGTEVYTQSLVEELAKKHQLMILCTGGPRMEIAAPVDVASDNPNIRQKLFPSRVAKSFKETYDTPAADNFLIKELQEFSPDIVHIQHLLYQSISFIDRIAESGIPFVMTLHDYWYICPQCFLTHCDGSLCDGPGSGNGCLACGSADGNNYLTFADALTGSAAAGRLFDRLKPLFPPGVRQWARKIMVGAKQDGTRSKKGFTETTDRLHRTVAALNKAAGIIAPSPVLARRYTEAGVKNVSVIPHGICTPGEEGIDHQKYRRPRTSPPTFGYIGAHLPYKGIHILIEAFNKLTKGSARLLIYGRSGLDQQYDKTLAALAAYPHSSFMGPFEHERIFTILSGIDAVVMPSICTENYPLVASEAFMARTPVIASNVGGLNQLIDDKKNGYLFEQGNVEQLAGILAEIVRHPDVLGTLSDNIPPVKNIADHAAEIEAVYARATAMRKG